MRQRYFHTGTSKITFLLDILAVLVSLLLALAIRAQFLYYLFTLSAAIALFSLTLFFRILTMFLFDAYSLSFGTLTNSDMQRIMRINLIPSLLLYLLRVISPTASLRMPYSMIIIEYIATTLGFVLIRTAMHNRLVKSSHTIGYRRRILLWAETADILEIVPHLDEFCQSQKVEIRGILNANPMFWQTEYQGLRVFGDESALRDLLFSDDRISALCFLVPQELTRNRFGAIVPLLRELNLEIGVIRKRLFAIVSLDELHVLANGRVPGRGTT